MHATVEAIREIYWNINPTFGQLLIYLLAIAGTLYATRGLVRDIARWRRGRPTYRADKLAARLLELGSQVFGQKRVLRDRKPGLMHALIFFGFLALFIGTEIIAVEEDFTVPLIGEQRGKILVGTFYQSYEFILDALGLVFVAGLTWAFVRRYRHRPERLDNRRTDLWVLGALLFIGVGGFLMEGLRLANQTIGGVPVFEQSWARLSFVGYPLAVLFRAIGLGNGSPVGLALHQGLWVTHAFVSFAAIAGLTSGKLRHIVYTPLNMLFRDTGPKGALPLIPNLEAEIEKDEPALGVATLADLTWKQRLDLDACMRCGRCQASCPAHAAGTDLSPKWLITKLADLQRELPVVLKDGTSVYVLPEAAPDAALLPVPVGNVDPLSLQNTHGTSELAGGGVRVVKGQSEHIPLVKAGLFSENELWSCTTCGACMHECPALIEHVDTIVDMRRNLAMIQSEVPQGVKNVLQGIERQGNPWRLPARERASWAEGLEVPTLAEVEQVDVLYWVGCAPSYDERSRRVARAMVQLMRRAGLDFAILGEEETCTGDPARRLGEELLFQAKAEENIETLRQYKFKRVVTTCAHCFNTLGNEYGQLDPQRGTQGALAYETIHHTQLLAELVAQGRLRPSEPLAKRIAYHDPCYIGRYNDVYDEPRELLRAIPGLTLVEAPERNRERAMCCGGGGGNVWMEGWGKRNVNTIRLEQLTAEQPDGLALACPFCMVMFEDAAKNTGRDETLGRYDVAELLLESLGPAAPDPAPGAAAPNP
jgi:Fe-S oxidoreductase